jgi:hypothetical protein
MDRDSQLTDELHELCPETAGSMVVRGGAYIMLFDNGGTRDVTDRMSVIVNHVRRRRAFNRAVDIRRSYGHQRQAIARRPRARGAGRPKGAPARRTTAGGSRDEPPDDDGPAEPAPALAPPPKPILSFASSRCPACGGVLLWQGGTLACATRSCPLYGKVAA